MKTKKRILYSLLLSTLIYILTSFVKWDIFWITEIPTYEASTRFITLILYLCAQMPLQIAITTEEL
jgi:hypothetical protein